jgi:hypothetical protein
VLLLISVGSLAVTNPALAQRHPHGRPAVLVMPPDSALVALDADSNVVPTLSWITGPILPIVTTGLSTAGAVRANGQAAVDRVGGEVVGGVRLTADLGSYHIRVIRVASDAHVHTLERAVAMLSSPAQVATVAPEVLVANDANVEPALIIWQQQEIGWRSRRLASVTRADCGGLGTGRGGRAATSRGCGYLDAHT